MVIAKCMINPPKKFGKHSLSAGKDKQKKAASAEATFFHRKNFSRCNHLLGETHGASLTDDGDLNLTRIGHFGLDFL